MTCKETITVYHGENPKEKGKKNWNRTMLDQLIHYNFHWEHKLRSRVHQSSEQNYRMVRYQEVEGGDCRGMLVMFIKK